MVINLYEIKNDPFLRLSFIIVLIKNTYWDLILLENVLNCDQIYFPLGIKQHSYGVHMIYSYLKGVI